MPLTDERKVGDRRAFELVVDLGATTDISGLTSRFYMRSIDMTVAAKINAATATKTDITAAEKAAGRAPASAPNQSIWLLSYAPTGPDVDTAGHYLGEFEVIYSGSQTRFYPPGDEFIRIEIAQR
jgi:hypothetical protein